MFVHFTVQEANGNGNHGLKAFRCLRSAVFIADIWVFALLQNLIHGCKKILLFLTVLSLRITLLYSIKSYSKLKYLSFISVDTKYFFNVMTSLDVFNIHKYQLNITGQVIFIKKKKLQNKGVFFSIEYLKSLNPKDPAEFVLTIWNMIRNVF